MIEQSVLSTGSCESCGKSFRIPDENRTYACKSCGGAVRANAAATEQHVADGGTLTCTACGTVNPQRRSKCGECGAALDEDELSPSLRHEANWAFKRAYKLINAVRMLYRFGAVFYAGATVLAILALVRTDVPAQAGALVVGLTTLLSVLMLMGAIHILFNPFLWTLIIAVLATLVSAVHLIGPNPLGLAFAGSAAWAVLAWAVLVPTYRFSKLIATHRDLYVLHHASRATKRAVRDRTPGERHERLMGAMHGAATRAWRISAALASMVALTSALGTYTVLAHLRPQVLGNNAAAFEAAWNDSDLAGVADFFAPELRAEQLDRLQGMTTGHGFGAALPPLRNGQPQQDGVRASVHYEVGDIDLTASWFLDGQTWTLLHLTFPAPPLEPISDRFLEGWRNSDVDALVACFSPDSRARMRESISRAVKSRGWKTFPAIVDVDLSSYEHGDAIMTVVLETGEVTTQWHLRANGRWLLNGLKFPKNKIKR